LYFTSAATIIILGLIAEKDVEEEHNIDYLSGVLVLAILPIINTIAAVKTIIELLTKPKEE